MKKILVAVALTCMIPVANAGFVTGVIVGSAMSGSKEVKNAPVAIHSDKYDVITCPASTEKPYECEHSRVLVKGVWETSVSVYVYAKEAGYSFVHRVSSVVIDYHTQVIAIEVSR